MFTLGHVDYFDDIHNKLIRNDKQIHFILYPLELFLGSVLVEFVSALLPEGLSTRSVTPSDESFKSSPSSSLTVIT